MQLAMVAGEASGDLLGSALLAGLQQRWPDLQAAGIGGPRMAAQGFTAWWPHEKLAVRGYVEVLRHYREIAAIREALAARLLTARPQAFIGIDAPDFNLGLEARLKAAGMKTIHFICPSIWAWRGGRAQKMVASCDLVLCLFPFEPELLAQHGVAAAFVGHPLADAIPLVAPRAFARAALGLSEADGVVAGMPGSRRSEISAIAPVFLQAAVRMQHTALAACDVTLIASGTATLEAALFKRPMVIGYRMHPVSWQIMKRLRYQPWVGLPNILLRDFAVPELIQQVCQPEALARAALTWLDDAPGRDRLASRFNDLHHLLRRDTAVCATDAIAQALQI